jgi:uncharacterized protein involved in outer membrane biogenesis
VRKIALAALVLLFLIAVTTVLVVRSRLANDRIKATLETQASTAIGEPVHIATLDVRWFPRPGLTLGGVTVGETRTLTIERLVLSTGLRPLLSGHIAEADVLVQQSRLDAPRFFAILTAPSTTPQRATASPLPLTIDAIRSIELQDVSLTSGRRTVAVNAQLAYAADGLRIQRLDARSDVTQLRASGAITDLARRVGNLTIDAASLDLDGLIEFMAPFGSSAEPRERTSATSPFDITTKLSAKSGRALGAAFSDLAATSRVTNGRASLDGLRFSLFGGRFDGAVLVRTDATEPQYDWRGAFANVDVARLVEFAGARNAITGTLQARVSLRGAGGSVQEAFTTAAGTSDVVIRNGRVPGLEIVRTVILAFGRPSNERPAGSGEEFRELAATLAVSGGRATTHNLTFASRDFDMRGQGWIDLRTQGVDLNVDLVLSRDLSAQAGRDLYRYASEGDRIVLPGRITGTAAHPSITIDTAAALKRALQNTIKSRVKSLFDRIIR